MMKQSIKATPLSQNLISRSVLNTTRSLELNSFWLRPASCFVNHAQCRAFSTKNDGKGPKSDLEKFEEQKAKKTRKKPTATTTSSTSDEESLKLDKMSWKIEEAVQNEAKPARRKRRTKA